MKTNRVFKKVIKTLSISILILFILVVVLIGIALNSEKTITDKALDEVNSMFDTQVKVDNVKLLIFKNFPFITVEFTNVKLEASNKDKKDSLKTNKNDTVAVLQKLYISLKTKPLFKSKIEIRKIEIEGFSFNFFIDENGKTNIDFLLASDPTKTEQIDTTNLEKIPIDLLLNNLTLRDVSINFRDKKIQATTHIHIPKMDIAGRVLNDYYKGTIKGGVTISNTSFKDTKINLMNQTSITFNINYDNGNVGIESFNLLTDGANLNAKGIAKLGDSIFVDMNVNLLDANFSELSKYIPDKIHKKYGIVYIKGMLDIKTKINGYIYDTLLLPKVKTNLNLHDASIRTFDYPMIKNLAFEGLVDILNAKDIRSISANFKHFNITTPESKINLSFDISNFEKPTYNVNSTIALNLAEFKNYIPNNTIKYLNGNVNLELITHGVLPNNLGINSLDYFMDNTTINAKLNDINTAIDSTAEIKNFSTRLTYTPKRDLTIENLTVNVPSYNVKIDTITVMAKLLGKISDMNNMGINLDSLYLKMGNTNLIAKAKLKGLKVPQYTLQSTINLDLEELHPFIPDTLVTHLAGKITLNTDSYGKLNIDSINTQALKIAFEQTKLNLNIENLSLEIPKDTLTKIDHLDLTFAIENDTIKIDNLYAKAQGINLKIDSTEIWNLYKALLLKQKDKIIILQTNVNIGDFDYAFIKSFLAKNLTTSEENESVENIKNTTLQEEQSSKYTPKYIARGTFAAKSFKYGDIILDDISTKFRIDDSLYVADNFELKAFGGKMKTSAVYDTRLDTQIVVYFKSAIEKIDINRMLVEGKNFEQEEFTSENIKGVLSSKIDGRIYLTKNFDIIYKKMIVKGDIKLDKGAIYNYKPLSELSEIKLPGLKNLDSLIFQTLTSQAFIYKNKIYFPKTDIITSATDITAYGMQSLNDDYEYHLKLYLRDVFFSKNKSLLKKQGFNTESGENKAGKRKGLEVVAKDIDGNKKHGADNQSLQRIMNTKIRLQNRGLSLIFHPKLVNFSTKINRQERTIK